MSASPAGERLAAIEAELRNIKEDRLPERMSALESWRSLLLGIGTAITLMCGVAGFVWGEAIKKALGGP